MFLSVARGLQAEGDGHRLLDDAALVGDTHPEAHVSRRLDLHLAARLQLLYGGARKHGDGDQRHAVDPGLVSGLADTREQCVQLGEVEHVARQEVGGLGDLDPADSVVGHGFLGLRVDEVHIVGVRSREVGRHGGHVGGRDLAFAVHGRKHRVSHELHAAGAHFHAQRVNVLLCLKRVRRLQHLRPTGDLVLLFDHAVESGGELGARVLQRIDDDAPQVRSYGVRVRDGLLDALEVIAVAADLAVVLTAADPESEQKDHHKKDDQQDGDPLDALHAFASSLACGGGRGRRRRGGGSGFLVLEEVHAVFPLKKWSPVGNGGRGGT